MRVAYHCVSLFLVCCVPLFVNLSPSATHSPTHHSFISPFTLFHVHLLELTQLIHRQSIHQPYHRP